MPKKKKKNSSQKVIESWYIMINFTSLPILPFPIWIRPFSVLFAYLCDFGIALCVLLLHPLYLFQLFLRPFEVSLHVWTPVIDRNMLTIEWIKLKQYIWNILYIQYIQQCIVKVVRKTLKLYGKGGILWLQISAV